ncbi:MAG: winged helix DNA-binding domain-containing protein [Gemmatimonadota bacterium]|nr:winged helix DNA-binding domain-containing protein [Gemmatimonadota bacterium]
MSHPNAMSLTDARARWFAAQRLPQGTGSAVEAVEKAGYVRTLGGVDVYLALRARVRGLTRARVDEALAGGDLRVVPSVRGCIYLVTRAEVPWCLRIADLLSRSRRKREYDKAGIRPGELEALGDLILEALSREPASTIQLRGAMKDHIRSLGDEGKRVGISSTLPPALRELEFQGRLERTLEEDRLDTEKYLWRATPRSLLDGSVPQDPAAVHVHLARVFFRGMGVGLVDRFATWAGLGKRDARTAAARLDGEPVVVEGLGAGYLALADCPEPGPDGVSFLPFEDNLIQHQAGVAPLVDPSHHHIPVPVWGRGKAQTLGTATHMAYRSIVRNGEVVGVWEYDPDGQDVVWTTFAPLGGKTSDEVEREAQSVASFLRDDVGRAISFSIDTEDDLRRRVSAIRRMST